MLEVSVYGISFFAITLFLQYAFHKIRKNQNQGSGKIWAGKSIIMILCIGGILNHDINYFAAIAGFICADEIGKTMEWH